LDGFYEDTLLAGFAESEIQKSKVKSKKGSLRIEMVDGQT